MLGLIAALGGATLLSGLIQSNSASKAAKAQTSANKAATAESARQFDAQMAQYRAEQDAALQRYYATQSALSPYTQTGTSALIQQRNLLGLDPDRQAMIDQANTAYEKAVSDARAKYTQPIISSKAVSKKKKNKTEIPSAIDTGAYQTQANAELDSAISLAEEERQKAIDYANSLPSGSEAQKAAIAEIEQGSEFTELAKQGETGILSNASATGGLRGGNTQGALAQFRPSLLNSLINQQYERLGSLSGMGMSSILGGAGYSGPSVSYPSGQNTIDLILNQGSINAGNALAQGNAWASIPNAFASGIGMYGAMGGFGSSTQNRGTTNSATSGLTMPYHTAF